MKDNLQKNKLPIYTNYFDVIIDREKVDKQYVIYQIRTTNSYFKTNVLDITSNNFKAFSVAYYRDCYRWFALFIRGKNNLKEFATMVQSNDDSATIHEVNLLSTDYESVNAIKDVELAQLLTNTLMNTRAFEYNNITGALYYKLKSFINGKECEFLKLRFFESNGKIALEANVETYTEYTDLVKYKKDAEQKYVFDKDTGEFRKALQSDFEFNKDNPKNKYVFFDKGVISKKGKKRHDFLNFNSYEQFDDSKCGVIYKFLLDVKKELSDYITIEQLPIFDYEPFDNPRSEYENKNYKEYFKKKGREFSVVDTVKTTESKELQIQIIEILKSEYGITNIQTSRFTNNYNIEIIHEKDPEYYDLLKNDKNQSLFPELEKPKDQHNLFTEDDIIQHVTIENFDLKNSAHAKMQNLIQELIIKGDIHDGQISIANWNESKEWTYVSCGKRRWNNLKKRNEYIYYKANIKTDGVLILSKILSSEVPEDKKEWELIDYIFRFYNKKQNLEYNPVECIVYNEISNVNVIYKSKQFTLPNLKKLSNDLKVSDKTQSVSKAVVSDILIAFENEHLKITETEKKVIAIMRKNLEQEPLGTITLGALRNNVKINTIRRLVKYFKTHGVPIHASPKSNDNRDENFNSLLGVKKVKINGVYKYFVGKANKALKDRFICSCRIRDVIPWINGELKDGSEVFLDEFAHMLTVEFVRNGQYTVIPFPMKYLREYQQFIEKDIDFDF